MPTNAPPVCKLNGEMTFRLSGIFPPHRIRSGQFRMDRRTGERPERETFAQLYCLDPSEALAKREMNDFIIERCGSDLLKGNFLDKNFFLKITTFQNCITC